MTKTAAAIEAATKAIKKGATKIHPNACSAFAESSLWISLQT